MNMNHALNGHDAEAATVALLDRPADVQVEEPAPVDPAQVEAELRAKVEEYEERIRGYEAAINTANAAITRHAETIESQRSRLTDAIQKHKRDIALIGEALLDTADRREWCDEYDEAVESLNRKLHEKLPTREREYTVTVEITVTGHNVDEARDSVHNMLRHENYDITEVEEGDFCG